MMSLHKINKLQLPRMDTALPTYDEAVGGNYKSGFRPQYLPQFVSDIQSNNIFRKQKLVCQNNSERQLNQNESIIVKKPAINLIEFYASPRIKIKRELEEISTTYKNDEKENNFLGNQQNDRCRQCPEYYDVKNDLEDSLKELQEQAWNIPEWQLNVSIAHSEKVKSNYNRLKMPLKNVISRACDEKKKNASDKVQYFLDQLNPHDTSFTKPCEILNSFTAEDWMTLSRRLESSQLW